MDRGGAPFSPQTYIALPFHYFKMKGIKKAIIRLSITFITIYVVSLIVTLAFSNMMNFSIMVGLPIGFVSGFCVFMFLTIKKEPKTKIKTLQIISMTSLLLCIGILLVYHWFTKQTSELDILSHFFGGLTTSSVISLIIETQPVFNFLVDYKFNSLVLVVVMYEFFEYIFLAHVIPDLEYVPTVTQPFDTITDIMAGLLGGFLFIVWEMKKYGRRENIGK